MLTVNDDGVSIRLAGQANNPLFWWSLGLLVLGVIVAIICFTLPVEYAIGSLFLFAVAMFGFNIKRQKAKRHHVFATGELVLTPKRFVINDASLKLSESAVVRIEGEHLIICDRGIEYQFMGFENAQELDVARQVLQGKSIQSRAASIRMVDS